MFAVVWWGRWGMTDSCLLNMTLHMLPHKKLQFHYHQISPKIKRRNAPPALQVEYYLGPRWPCCRVLGLSGWCRLYIVLSPSSCLCIWFVSSSTQRGLLSVSTMWRPSWLLLHPTWASLGCSFCFSVYMLLGQKKTNPWDKVCSGPQSREMNILLLHRFELWPSVTFLKKQTSKQNKTK